MAALVAVDLVGCARPFHRQRFVQRMIRQIDAKTFRQPSRRRLLVDIFEQAALNLPRFRLRLRQDRADAGQNLQLLRLAPVFRQPRLHVLVERPGAADALMGGEDDLRHLRRKFLAVFRRAGLHEHRISLRRPGDIQRALHGVIFASVVDRVNFIRIETNAGQFVVDDGVILPAVPQLLHNVDEFVRFLVSQLMLGMRRHAEVVRRRARPGDNIPAGPAFADMIQRGEFAGDVERLVVGRAYRRDQADMLRPAGQRRQLRERLQLVRPPAVAVGQKHGIHQPPFGGLHDLQNMADIQVQLRPRFGQPPGCLVMARAVQERVQMQLTFSTHAVLSPSHRCLAHSSLSMRKKNRRRL